MPANLENPAVATGLEKVSFHFNPKERQCQRMFKLLHNCIHLTWQPTPVLLPGESHGQRRLTGYRPWVAKIWTCHLEPDILECEFKWVLESITTNKASGGDGIPVELFQILKDDAVKVLHSICQQIWKTQQWSQDWKESVLVPIPKKGSAKEFSNYRTITLISHTSNIILKILQARLQQYVNCELPDVQAGFRKGKRIRYQITNICWIIEKAREFQKKHIFLLY